MTTGAIKSAARRGFTLPEAIIGAFIIMVVSMAGLYAYAEARITTINEWHEQNALFLGEREIESWQGAGYTGLSGWAQNQVVDIASPSNTFLPYGYAQAFPDPEWNTTGRFKPVALNDFQYRVRAQLWYSAARPEPPETPTDFFVEDTWNNGSGDIVSRYRLVRVHIQWGNFSGFDSDKRLVLETRIAR